MNFLRSIWKRTFSRLPGLLRFVPIYFWEMTQSNVRVAIDALRPSPRFQPGIIRVSVAGYDPIECWEAACLISMTPGTLVLDLEDRTQELVVHSLYLHDADAAREDLERLVRQALGTPKTL